jgi:hypothetical protein
VLENAIVTCGADLGNIQLYWTLARNLSPKA